MSCLKLALAVYKTGVKWVHFWLNRWPMYAIGPAQLELIPTYKNTKKHLINVANGLDWAYV